MKRLRVGMLFLIFTVLGSTVFLSSLPRSKAQEAKDLQISVPGVEKVVFDNQLWLTYNDINNGFSLRYPYGLEIVVRSELVVNEEQLQPSDIWFGDQMHVITRMPTLSNDMVARNYANAEAVSLPENRVGFRLERSLFPIDGMEATIAIEYLIRTESADYFLIYEPKTTDITLEKRNREIFERVVESFRVLNILGQLDSVQSFQASAADSFDFFVNPPDGGTRAPSYAAYAAYNGNLTSIAPCYNKPYSQLMHTAEDWFRNPGTNVHAVANGTVIYSQNANYPGAVVIIEHTLPSSWQNPWGGNIIYSVYSHLATSGNIAQWSDVTKGQIIGTILDYPGEGNNHIHFEMRRYGDMTSILVCPANGKKSFPGPGYTNTGDHPDNYGYTNPSSWIDGHREAAPPPDDKWTAKYYDTIDKWNDDTNNGNLRCEREISGSFLYKVYGTGAECGMDGDGWVGEYQRSVNLTGMYVFYAKHDDGFRMWLNNDKLYQRDSKSEGWFCPAVNLAGNYNFRVMLREDGGDADIDFKWSTETSVCNPPGTPTLYDIANADGDGNYTVSWSTANQAQVYQLEERPAGGSWQKIQEDGGTSRAITGKAQGDWCYRVRARTANSVDGNWSQEKCTTVGVPPPFPPTLSVPSNGATIIEGESIALSWNSAANATEYYGVITGGPTQLSFGWQSSTSRNLGAQWPGYVYNWKVKARNSFGESTYSDTWTFTVIPKAPSNLTLTDPTCNSVVVAWRNNSQNVDSFRIYRNGSEIRSYSSNVTSFTDQGLLEYTTYTYTVKAVRNTIASNASAPASVTTPDCSVPPPDPPVLVSPPNNAKIVEGESIVLTWNSVTDATGYFGSITDGPSPMTFGWQTGTSKKIGSQSPGYEYFWEVKARNGSVEGNYSNKWVFIVIPKAPSNLSASVQSCSSVNLTWTDNSSSEDGYKIYRNGAEVGLVGAGGSSYTDQGLQEQTSYSYVVRAHRNGLHSNPSNSASITTSPCNGDTTAPQVVWVEPVGDTESYNVSGETVTLKVNATDNVAVEYVIFSRWDHPTQQAIEISTDFQAPYTAQVDTSEFTNDWNEVRAQAVDSAGNESDRRHIWLYYEPDDGSLGTPPVNSIDNADGDGNYTVDWPQIDDATGYKLQEQYDFGSWSQVYNGPNTSVDRASRSDGEWCYRVRAYNDSDQSDWSVAECVTVNPDIEPPLVPVLDSIGNAGQQSSYWVTWGTVDNAASYELQERYYNGSFSPLYSGSSTSHYVFGQGEGQWCYRVRASGPGGTSDWSQIQCTTVDLDTGGYNSFIPMVTD